MMNSKKKRTVGNINYRNNNLGFSITIPDNFLEVKKTSYQDLGVNNNTLFIFVVDKFTSISGIFSGFASSDVFDKLFDNLDLSSRNVLYKDEKEFNGVSTKQLIIEENDKKIMNNFCLINGMIINFTINIDPNNRVFDSSLLVNTHNFKVINEVLSTLYVFEASNPPIYLESEVDDEVNEEIVVDSVLPEEFKTNAETLIEEDCRHRNLQVPNFYLRYNENSRKILLTITGDEVFLKNLDSKKTTFKKDEELVVKVKKLIEEKWDKLLEINCVSNKLSDSSLLIKKDDVYLGVDLEKKNYSIVSKIYSEIVVLLLADKKEIEEQPEEIMEPLVVDNQIEENNELPVEEKIEEVTPEVKEEIPEEENKLDEVSTDEEQPLNLDDKTEEATKPNITPAVIFNEEPVSIAETPVEVNEEDNEEEQSDVQNEEIEQSDLEINEEPSEDIEVASDEPTEIEEPDDSEIEEKDSIINNTTFEEYYHNVDGHASFKFLFPVNSGEKIDREFNVFDIVDNDELKYRIFIFKCESEEAYEDKLNDWMSKNVTSSNSPITNSYSTVNDNNVEIKTYILENGKFYKSIYLGNYLVAISGLDIDNIMIYSDYALNNIEIGEDSKEYIESLNRKMHSIEILKYQNIPYIDELPGIISSYEVEGKTLEDITKRAIALCISCNFASDIVNGKKKRYLKESKKFFTKLLDKLNVKDALTPNEKALFDKMDNNIAVQISWQFEGYAVLLWTLGLIDDIPYPNTLVDPDYTTSIVSACDSYREFVEKCNLRDINEILDLADLTYRYNWYCVESEIAKEECVLNSEVVVERHRALNWLLTKDAKWDDVEINT